MNNVVNWFSRKRLVFISLMAVLVYFISYFRTLGNNNIFQFNFPIINEKDKEHQLFESYQGVIISITVLKYIKDNKLELKGKFSRGLAYELIFSLVEDKLIQPTIIYDFPAETSILAKPKEDDPLWAERFEAYVNGYELINSYSELHLS